MDIKTLLAAVRERDSNCEVFGSNQHRYNSVAVPIGEIESFERRHTIALPDGFRDFLLEVGVGAGPYYGLWSLHDTQREMDDIWREYEIEENTKLSASSPFPLTRNDAMEIRRRINAQENEPYITADYPCNGCIPICHQGCTFWSLLITAGELRGSVWDVANYVGFEGLWLPSCRPTGLLLSKDNSKELPRLSPIPTFREWFESWLERCFVDLDMINAR